MLPDNQTLLTWAAYLAGAFVIILWLSLVIWTARDIRARTFRPLARFTAALWVLVTFLPGWLIYLILRPRRTLESEYLSHLEEEALLQQLHGSGLCPTCQKSTSAEWLVCPHCQTLLRQRCPSCAKPVDAGWVQCPFCAAALAPREPAPLPLD